jgi:hypothetical protein
MTDGGDCLCSIRIGFTKDPDEYLAELRAQAASQKWIAKRQPLQTAYTEHVGWLNYFPQETDVDSWAVHINLWIAKHHPPAPGKDSTHVGLEYRAIYDGLGAEARKRMSDKERWAKRAVHVVCKRGEKQRVTTLIRSFLQSTKFKYLCCLPSRLIPMLPYGVNSIFLAKYQEATLKHMKLTHYGTGNVTTFAFASPDKQCNLMPDRASIRSMILRIRARATDPPQPLFLALNPATKPQEKGGFVITYSKAHESEAVEKISNIAAFFLHHYGAESLERFTAEACEQANLTKWDAANDRPITLEEQDLEAVMDEEIEWLANLDDINFGKQPNVEVVLDRPLPANASRVNPHPTSADADTVGTFFPRQKITTQEDDSDGLTNDTSNAPSAPHALANDESRETRPPSEASGAEDPSGSLADEV